MELPSNWTTPEFWLTLGTWVLSLVTVLHPGFTVQKWYPIVQLGAVLAASVVTSFFTHATKEVRLKAMEENRLRDELALSISATQPPAGWGVVQGGRPS